MYFADSSNPFFSQEMEEDEVGVGGEEEGEAVSDPSLLRHLPCNRGHRSSLNLPTHHGGSICLVCFTNLLNTPHAPTLHVSYALSQLSQALSQPPFLRSLLAFHSHLLVSPLVHALSSFDDEPIADQVIHLIKHLCDSAGESLASEFVTRVSDALSSRALGWSRRQVFTLHCLGVLLNCLTNDCLSSIKDKDALISNLGAGLQLPSEDIQGEILFVLYKLSLLYSPMDNGGTDPFLPFCPKLLHLSLEVLMKTQSDDVRMNCIAFLIVLTQRGLFQVSYVDGMNISAAGADNYAQLTESSNDGYDLHLLFAEAVKGSLLSSDKKIQISVLDLVSHYLSCEEKAEQKVQCFVENNVGDYVFEILRLSEISDPVVCSCLRVLDILSTAEQAFQQKLSVGFATLIPVLQYVADVPYHSCQSPVLKLVSSCISNIPGAATTSQCEEMVSILTRMLRRHSEGSMGMLSETFAIVCSILVNLIKSPRHNFPNLAPSIQEASKVAILSCLTNDIDPNQLLEALYLLKEAYEYGHENNYIEESIKRELKLSIRDVCAKHILPWLVTAVNEWDEEEVVLGVLETFHFILNQESDDQTREFAETMASFSWFSLSFKCLGLFPTERMKWRVYLMLGSLVDMLLGNECGEPIRDALCHLPSDPNDMLFLLGQNNAHNVQLSSCQSAIFTILYCSSLFDERFADDRLVLASLEQYILVNYSCLSYSSADSVATFQLVNLYGLYRGIAKMSYQFSCSMEAERIFIQLVAENEWDLPSAPIHLTSLKWLFQQEKISSYLSYQILKFCRIYISRNSHAIICGKNAQVLDVQAISELVAAGDTYAAKIFICLFDELVKEKIQENDLVSMLSLTQVVIELSPAAADQLSLNGIGRAMQILYCDSSNIFPPRVYIDALAFISNLLVLVNSEAITDDDAWLALTIKLMDQLICKLATENFACEVTLILGILCLILHHSMDGALTEAAKAILLSTSITSIISDIIQEACSSGPALLDNAEVTSTSGRNLMNVLLLQFFSFKSVCTVLDGLEDCSPVPLLSSRCDELCLLLHFGSPSIKVVASYCLLELFKKVSGKREEKHSNLVCMTKHLKSVVAVMEGLVFYSDSRVAINCGLCLAIIYELEKEKTIERNKWCRMIVEELAMSLAVRTVGSKSCMNYHKASVYVAIAVLKLEQVPGWMSLVFDESCISGILRNLGGSDLSIELILLFRELWKAEFLNGEHTAGLNRLLQVCRKMMYRENMVVDGEETNPRKEASAAAMQDDGSAIITDHLIRLMSSCYSSSSSSGENDWRCRGPESSKMSEEIEKFCCDINSR